MNIHRGGAIFLNINQGGQIILFLNALKKGIVCKLVVFNSLWFLKMGGVNFSTSILEGLFCIDFFSRRRKIQPPPCHLNCDHSLTKSHLRNIFRQNGRFKTPFYHLLFWPLFETFHPQFKNGQNITPLKQKRHSVSPPTYKNLIFETHLYNRIQYSR